MKISTWVRAPSRWGLVVFFGFQVLGSCNRMTMYAGVCCPAELIDESKLLQANLTGTGAGQMTWTVDYDTAQPIDLSHLLRDHSAAPLIWTANGADLKGSLLHPKSRPADDKVAIYDIGVHRRNDTRRDQFRVILLPSTTRERFAAWYEQERKDMTWLSRLPPAYSTLGPGRSNPEPENCTKHYWEKVHKFDSNFHPGGAFEMRSRPIQGGHGHQAVYDSQGRLIREGPGAGSADKGAPIFFGLVRHRDRDVRPYVWAAQLDGNPVDPVLFFRDLDAPLLRKGVHIAQYQSVRPALAGSHSEIPAGTCIGSR